MPAARAAMGSKLVSVITSEILTSTSHPPPPFP